MMGMFSQVSLHVADFKVAVCILDHNSNSCRLIVNGFNCDAEISLLEVVQFMFISFSRQGGKQLSQDLNRNVLQQLTSSL